MNDRSARAPTSKGLEFLGAVAGGLVHEIRNPLSTMNVTLQLLQEEFPDGTEDDRGARTSRRLKALLDEVRRLEEILDDFLRYAGIRRLNLAQVDLNRVLEEVTAFMLPECARAGIDLAFYPDRSLPIMRLDERLVKQAVLNLLLNAVQAMEDPDAKNAEDGADGAGSDGRGEGRPGDRQLILRTRLEGESARVDVIDTGPGIPPRIRERIWEVYYSRKRTGSGLGLPTARRIAEEHGGDLQLQSDVGKGSDFILRLPLGGPPEPPPGQ